MHYAFRVSTAPSVEPVSLADAKAHCRVDFGDDDAYLRSLIIAARQTCEERTRRSFITQTHVMNLDCFPGAVLSDALIFGGDPILLPRAPVISVTSIQYVDDQGATQTLSTSAYRSDLYSHVPRITPAYGYVWPTTRPQTNAVTVTYVAGYGVDVDDVPEPIRLAMKIMVGTWYEQREAVVTGTISTPIPMSVGFLLAPYVRAEVLS